MVENSDRDTDPIISEYDASLGSLPGGLYVAFARAFAGSSGFPKASHSLPVCDEARSCFDFFESGLALKERGMSPASARELVSRDSSAITVG